MSSEIQKWADPFMFTAEKSDADAGPQVYLLGAPADPLGHIAACAKMYKGEVVRDLADVTDDERREYLAEMQKTKLKMPLESVNLHFMIEGVTRGFTHQMVRQRTAAYAQESTRFAVKEDLKTATALPPSLAGTEEYNEWHEPERESDAQRMRYEWDSVVDHISEVYNKLVNMGMPAEDARGLMPTNITTRLNYITNLRGLLDHAGNRLCTQAQFEWRMAFAQIAFAMRAYGRQNSYRSTDVAANGDRFMMSSAWQWDAIADLLKPVCYQTGGCAFKANFDRACSIRDRVNANEEINRPSTEWHEDYDADRTPDLRTTSVQITREEGRPVFIGNIQPREWLADPEAAR